MRIIRPVHAVCSTGVRATTGAVAGRRIFRRIRSGSFNALPVTRIEELDIATAAISGVARPRMAMGTATRL